MTHSYPEDLLPEGPRVRAGDHRAAGTAGEQCLGACSRARCPKGSQGPETALGVSRVRKVPTSWEAELSPTLGSFHGTCLGCEW